MAKARTVFLTREEMDLIHAQSMKSLQEIGIKIHSKPVLEMLEKNGAKVDYDEMIARIPGKMVTQALDTAPKEFVLCARDPKRDLKIPTETYPWVSTSGLAVFVKDHEDGEYRNSTRKDIAAFARLADAVDSADIVWTALTASDVTPLAHGPHELWTTLQNTTKHVQSVTAQSAEDARVQIELAALLAGGKEYLRKRPLFSVIACPIAPLSYAEGSIEAVVELARAGIPVASMSMSMGGVSAPVTVAGMLVNANTENLGSVVISQTAAPGAPQIYCSESAPMDMMTCGINYSSADKSLLSIALNQMARRYGMPSLVADGGWGRRVEGGIASVMTVANQLVGIMGGSDIVTGLGSVESAKGISFAQFVIDSYVWDCSRNYMHEVEISEEKAGLEAVRDVGHGHHFMMHPHTLDHLRGELTVWDRDKLGLLEMDREEMPAEANKIVKRILAEHQVEAVADDLVKKGDAIIRDYEAVVGN